MFLGQCDSVVSFKKPDGEVIEFYSDDAVITRYEITQPTDYEPIQLLGSNKDSIQPIDPLTINITLKMLPDKFEQIFYDKTYKPKLRNKTVNDCTVQELLFAIRHKVK